MSQLLPKDQLEAHVTGFKGVPMERKRQLAEHLAALPDAHHAAVRNVLAEHCEDGEDRFIRGCFGEAVADAAPTLKKAKAAAEHPDLPPAA